MQIPFWLLNSEPALYPCRVLGEGSWDSSSLYVWTEILTTVSPGEYRAPGPLLPSIWSLYYRGELCPYSHQEVTYPTKQQAVYL